MNFQKQELHFYYFWVYYINYVNSNSVTVHSYDIWNFQTYGI